jgi:hypothetical protein
MGQFAHAPLVHLGTVSYIHMLLYSLVIVLMDMIPVNPTKKTLLSVKTIVVVIYRVQPRSMVLASIPH